MGINTSDDVMSKAPSEVRIYHFELKDKLASGETLSSVSSSSVSPSGELAIDSASVSGTRCQVTVSGGTADTDYTVSVTVTTSNSQTISGEGVVQVRS